MAPMRPASLIRAIPADSLSEVGRDESTDNAKGRSEYEAFGLVLARRDELSNNARNKSDENDPKNVHVLSPPVLSAFVAIEHTGAQGDVPWVIPRCSFPCGHPFRGTPLAVAPSSW
jgi:hypothetical protein